MEKRISEEDYYAMVMSPSMEKIRGYLQLEMINAAEPKNWGMLENVLHMPMKDMAAVPVVRAEFDDGRIASAKITQRQLDRLGLSKEEFLTAARIQAAANSPVKIQNLSEFVYNMTDGEIPYDDSLPLYIATNDSQCKGASVITYPGFFEQAQKELGGDFYVLPSSIHEVLLVKDSLISRGTDPRMFSQMVAEINVSVVEEKERLTDNAYHYDAKYGFETVDEYLERMQWLDKRQNRGYGPDPHQHRGYRAKEELEQDAQEDEDIDF